MHIYMWTLPFSSSVHITGLKPLHIKGSSGCLLQWLLQCTLIS